MHFFLCWDTNSYKKSPANAKGNARQRRMFQGSLRTNQSSSIQQLRLGTMYLHTPDGATISRERCRSWNVCRSQKLPRNPQKPLFLHSRSTKVIDRGGNREPVYNFLLVINSNLDPSSHRYWDTVTYWPKIAKFAHPPSHLAPSFRVTPFEFMEKLYGSWN